MRTWTFPAGRLFGREVRIHWTFLALLLFVWLNDYGAAGGFYPERGLALVAIVFASVGLHELGHALVGALLGEPARSLLLLPVGGVSIPASEASGSAPGNLGREVRMAVAGPLFNLLAALVVGVIITVLVPGLPLVSAPWIGSAQLLKSLFWVNVLLAAVNTLPAYPLDAGRVLRALWAGRRDPMEATQRAVAVSRSLSLLLMFAGMFLNVGLTLVGVFVFLAGQIEERSVLFQSVLHNVLIEEVMLTDFATLSPADTLEDALTKATHSLQDDFPVIRGSDMVGVISRARILQAARRSNGYVQSAMNRFFEVAQRGDTLASVFRKIGKEGVTIVPVVEEERLVGIVTLQNLMHNMALLTEARRLRRQAQG